MASPAFEGPSVAYRNYNLDVAVEGEKVTIYTLIERVPVPLSILHHPICISFSFFHGGEIVLMDATLQEEQLSEGV
ncbi:hypothetical protein L211DRAFT_885359 [Terfezia boudieri ATCC MYA-4762]|uniref:Uncharacterized protein n=1 Tax=Terfezia boudieri ATCC MYA-4762 TaxID=1051890 RepID=A0A3N4LKX6_9PEZI|nr:hypothetical protein L211DRAFT_885359 [Terfezia boudieri ATCC MYA-4762]